MVKPFSLPSFAETTPSLKVDITWFMDSDRLVYDLIGFCQDCLSTQLGIGLWQPCYPSSSCSLIPGISRTCIGMRRPWQARLSLPCLAWVFVLVHGVFVLVQGVFVLVHGVFILVHGVFVLVHGVFVLVHGVFVLVHVVFVLVQGVFVLVHGVFVSVHGVFVLVHGVFVLVQGVFVLVHGSLGLRSSF